MAIPQVLDKNRCLFLILTVRANRPNMIEVSSVRDIYARKTSEQTLLGGPF